MRNWSSKLIAAVLLLVISCSVQEDDMIPDNPSNEDIYRLPVVVHVLHSGEPVGDGSNLSESRILRQIEILNEDFRRKEGTRGFNTHPDGGDARIEFVLAGQDPKGEPTNGIVRIDTSQVKKTYSGHYLNTYAQFSYWDPTEYINIWTVPFPEALNCLFLGIASGPETDLPGGDLLAVPGPNEAEGIVVISAHFGESEIDCHARFGRTLTHEMGHYLGLLHPWGARDCENNDFCDDTPPVDDFVYGRVAFPGCTGESVMIGNYMNYSDDEVMNIFTNDQISRMHYILENNPRRNALLYSKGLAGRNNK